MVGGSEDCLGTAIRDSIKCDIFRKAALPTESQSMGFLHTQVLITAMIWLMNTEAS